MPQVDWWDRPILNENFSYYFAPTMAERLVDEPSYSLADIQESNQEKVWDNANFHHKVVELLKQTRVDSSWLAPSLLDPAPAAMEPAALAEMFKPRVAQPVLQTRLTKEEKRKQAKARRREYQKDLQEKIKYGIIEAPKPKLKLSTYMKTLSAEAIQDPTKVEMEVRKLVEERQQKHLERNEARKLTSEQKREKSLKKLKKDSARECRVCLFMLKSLHDFKIRAKVLKNAQELALNGFCLVPSKDCAEDLPVVLVVEGGPKSIKFFKRLLLARIDWTAKRGRKVKPQEGDPDALDETATSSEYCSLVWEGIISDHIFPKWTIKEIHNELEGRKNFADRGVEEYWDKVLSRTRH